MLWFLSNMRGCFCFISCKRKTKERMMRELFINTGTQVITGTNIKPVYKWIKYGKFFFFFFKSYKTKKTLECAVIEK